jgi:hypothetical protein
MQIIEMFEYVAEPAAVFAMMTDERFQARKCEATNPLSHHQSVTTAGQRTTVITTREMPTHAFPDFAKSFVGASIAITETTVWSPNGSTSRVGTLTIGVAGVPVGFKGEIRLDPSPMGTEVTIEGVLHARIPFLGGRIERAALPIVFSGIRHESETGHAWLAEQA